MSRSYHLNHRQQPHTPSHFLNMDILEFDDKIINHSADYIYCDCLEYLDYSNIDSTISKILSKIKPGCSASICIKDIKTICSEVLTNKMPNNTLLENIKNYNCLLAPEDILTKLTPSYTVAQVLHENMNILITIQKNHL